MSYDDATFFLQSTDIPTNNATFIENVLLDQTTTDNIGFTYLESVNKSDSRFMVVYFDSTNAGFLVYQSFFSENVSCPYAIS